MVIHINQQQVLNYWQWFATFESLNQELLGCKQVDIQNGKLADDQSAYSGELMISPFNFEFNNQTIHPLWLPIYIDEQGRVSSSQQLPMPYVPSCYCDPLGKIGQILNKREIIDVVLGDFLDEQGKLMDGLAWDTYLSKAQGIFKELSPTAFELWQNQTSKIQIFEPKTAPCEPQGLAQRLFEMPDDEAQDKKVPLASLSDLFTSVKSEKLSENLIETTLNLLSLPKRALQSIKAPKAARQDALLETALLSLKAKSVQDNIPMHVLVVSPSFQFEQKVLVDKEWLAQVQSVLGIELRNKDHALDALSTRWQHEWAFLDKASTVLYQSQDDLPAQIEADQQLLSQYQHSDEQLEDEFVKLGEVYQDWLIVSKISWFGRIKQFLKGFDKNIFCAEFLAKYSVSIDWSEGQSIEETLMTRIRRIKVERAKINRAQTTLTSKMAEREGLLGANEKILQDYPDLKNLEASKRIPFLIKQRAQIRFQLLELLDEKSQLKVDCIHPDSLHNITSKQNYDWVFVQEAQSLKPIECLELLGQTDRMVVMGDPMLQQSFAVSESMDAIMLQHLGLIECLEDLDDLQYSGHLLSQSSLYTLIQPYDYIVKNDPTGLVQLQALQLREIECPTVMGEYYRSKMNEVVHLELESEGLSFMPCQGAFDEDAWINRPEAELITSYLKENLKEETCVVALSFGQQQLLSQLFEQKGLEIPVFTLSEAHLSFDHVIFSTVYDVTATRPHFLDCGEYPIYKLMTLAKCSLTLFGDEKLLKSNIHSPMGLLAKLLKAHQVNDVHHIEQALEV